MQKFKRERSKLSLMNWARINQFTSSGKFRYGNIGSMSSNGALRACAFGDLDGASLMRDERQSGGPYMNIVWAQAMRENARKLIQQAQQNGFRLP